VGCELVLQPGHLSLSLNAADGAPCAAR